MGPRLFGEGPNKINEENKQMILKAAVHACMHDVSNFCIVT